jgi:L-amino acid N-acyltransferase YncA
LLARLHKEAIVKRIVRIASPEELTAFTAGDAVSLVSSDELAHHAPDAHWLLADDGQRVVARCSLWWRTVPGYPEKRLGFIGHYAARDREAATKLLSHACAELAANGCTLAVGPLDGTTWRRYRFIVERGAEPVFFLEPDNPDDWPLHFTAAGFSEFASYSSSLNIDLNYSDPRLAAVAERMTRQGVSIRQLDPARFDQELDAIFELCLIGFQHNFLYTPIGQDEFKASYRKVQPFIRPELTLLAEHEGRTVGFLFAIPDMLQARREETVDTVVMKSIAVQPGKTYGGLGNLLMVRTIANIRELGYRRAIHALVYDSNSARNMSAAYAQPMRRYALFSRQIA